MLLIDSIYINNSGGKILLDYLVSELEGRNICPYYLFDLRCKDSYKEIPLERKTFLKASLRQRHQFYKKNSGKFSSAFCFGNIPPTVKLDIPVYTYMHNLHNLQGIYADLLKRKFRTILRKMLLTYLCKNTNVVIVQSDVIKVEFERKYRFHSDKVLVIPFFNIPALPIANNIKNNNSFVYISAGSNHKNHLRLLKTWELLAEENYYPELGLTVDELKFPDINNEIKKLQQNGLSIINYGFTDPYPLYDKYEYLIFPSLLETLGLGQVEAINRGCKVIASDLPHTYAVIQPSLTFDPFDVNSIKNAVKTALQTDGLPESKCIIDNRISELIELIK